MTQAYRLVNERQLYGVAAAFCVYLFFLLLIVTLDHEPPGEGDGELRRMTADERARIDR